MPVGLVNILFRRQKGFCRVQTLVAIVVGRPKRQIDAFNAIVIAYFHAEYSARATVMLDAEWLGQNSRRSIRAGTSNCRFR